LFRDGEMSRAGQRPAVNGGLSVSRVGGAAQTKAMRKAASKLRLELAQYRELQVFSRFSSDMDASTTATLRYGERLNALLKQPNHAPTPVPEQVAMLYALTHRLLPDEWTAAQTDEWKRAFPAFLRMRFSQLLRAVGQTGDLSDEQAGTLRDAAAQYAAEAAAPKAHAAEAAAS